MFKASMLFAAGMAVAAFSLGLARAGAPEWQPITGIAVCALLMYSSIFVAAGSK